MGDKNLKPWKKTGKPSPLPVITPNQIQDARGLKALLEPTGTLYRASGSGLEGLAGQITAEKSIRRQNGETPLKALRRIGYAVINNGQLELGAGQTLTPNARATYERICL
jgi:hypothetical protein